MKSRLRTIYEASTVALDEIEGWPCNLEDMTEREQQIANSAERLCGAMKFIQETSEENQEANITEDDCKFLIWALGFVEGRVVDESAMVNMPPERRMEVAKRCKEIWPKLSALL